MTDQLRERLRKVYELVNRGATEGEKAAAKAALDRLLDKYNLSEEVLTDITKKVYPFKYISQLEEWLIMRILKVMLNKTATEEAHKIKYNSKKEIYIKLEYLEYVTFECAYEYFRRHMRGEWNRVCANEVKRCRKAKTRNKRREELQTKFFSAYITASKLYFDYELIEYDRRRMSDKEYRQDRLMDDVQGGQYNKQVVTGNLLEAGPAGKPVASGVQTKLFD